MKYLNHIDLNKNSLLFGVIHPLASAPGTPSVGQVYYDTVALQPLFWNGSAFTNKATDSALLNGQNAAYYLARGNHTGTQLSASISDLATTVKAYKLSEFAAPIADVAMGGFKLTGLADPASAQDAATMGWVQVQVSNAAAGIDSKPSVRAIAVANITLSGTQTIDGVYVVAGDRVLAQNQLTATARGVYVVAAGAWARAVDADATGEITPGATWFVEEGTTYGASTWRCANTGTITLGSTSITITQLAASTTYTNGNGLDLAGNSFSVKVVASGGITVGAGGIQVDTAIVARKYSTSIGNGSLTSIAVTHSLGTKDVSVTMRQNADDAMVIADWVATDTNTVTATFAVAPAASAIRVTVVG